MDLDRQRQYFTPEQLAEYRRIGRDLHGRYQDWSYSRSRLGIAEATGGVDPLVSEYRNTRRRLEGAFNASMPQRQGEFVAGATNVVQRSYKKIKHGKKASKKDISKRVAEFGTGIAIHRYQRIGPYENFSVKLNDVGSLDLCHIPNVWDWTNRPAPATDNRVLDVYPVHLFDLTNMDFRNPNNTDPEHHVMHYRLVSQVQGTRSNTTFTQGDFFWLPQSSQDRLGANIPISLSTVGSYLNTAQGQYERLTGFSYSGSDETAFPSHLGRCLLTWADVRLVLYGARNQTTRFNVQLVQFKDSMYDPDVVPRGATTLYPASFPYGYRDTVQQETMNCDMQEFVKPLVFHPMDSAGAVKERTMKVLKSRTYVVGPDSSTNNDTAQPNVMVRMFENMNRKLDFVWAEDNNNIDSTATMDSATYNTFTNNTIKDKVHPKARVYLMVSAQSFIPTTVLPITEPATGPNVPVYTKENSPAFDIIIRRKFYYPSAYRT